MRPPSDGARALIACVMLTTQVVTWPAPAGAAAGQTRATALKAGPRPADGPQSTPRRTPEELALEHYKAGRFDLAIEVLEPRVENGGLMGDALLRARELLARSYAGAGRRDDAKGVFKVMLYQDPRYRPDPTSVTADERAIFALALSEYMAEMHGAPQDRATLTPPSSTPSPAAGTESGTSAGAATASPSPMPPAMPPQTTAPAPTAAPAQSPAPARRVYAGASPPPMRVSRPRSSRGWMWWTAGAALAGTATALAVAAGNNRTSTSTPSPGGGNTPPLPGYPPPPP